MKLIFIGMPGSGKGTQSELVAKRYGLPHISTGDIFRDNIKAGTELGKKADALISRGRFVPDSITNKIVKKRMIEPDCRKGFILDGYPRNLVQTQFMEKKIGRDFAVFIEICDETAKNRILGRHQCSNCKKSYNVFTGPKPKKEGHCDSCGMPLIQRKDDSETSFWHRMEIYHRLTEPIVSYYREKGILITVNGEQSVSDVEKELEKKLEIEIKSKNIKN
jgi:adenylate kinase